MRSASWVFASSVLTLLILAGAAPAGAQTPSTNADLDSITVDGTAVPGFDASRTSYAYGVAHDVSRVTVSATAHDSGATVDYSVADADASTAGLQIDLSNGRNEVTITVTAENPTETLEYVVAVNRGFEDAGKWKAVDDIDTLAAAGNAAPSSIWSDGTTMWSVDVTDDKVYAYTLSTGARDVDKEWDLHSDNGSPQGIWSDGTTMWVSDDDDAKVYAYTLSTGARDVDEEWDLHSDNSKAQGMWSDGTTMWVADTNIESKLFAYTLSTGDDAGKGFSIGLSHFTFINGIWSDGEIMWVAGHLGGSRVKGFRLSNGQRVTSVDYDFAGSDLQSISGIWSDGTTMWMSDPGRDKIYSYNAHRGAVSRLSALTVSPRDIIGFDGDRTSYQVGVDSTVQRATVTATPASNITTASYSAADQDPAAEGLQIDLSDGANEVTVTLTNALGATFGQYTVTINRGVADAFGWRAGRDLDGLGAVTDPGPNSRPAGIWTDGTDHWVLDSAGNRVYVYDRDGAFVAGKSFVFDTSAQGEGIALRGLWSDGETILTTAPTRRRVLAAQLDTGMDETSKEFVLNVANADPAGIWSDGEAIWIPDGADKKVYVYDSGNLVTARTIDATGPAAPDPTGVWSDGVTAWVAHENTSAVYAHDLDTGDRRSSLDFTALAPGNDNPSGIAGDGETLWITQDGSGSGGGSKVFAYNLPASDNADLLTLEVNGTEVAGFDPATTSYDVAVAEEVREVTVSGAVRQIKAEITGISPADDDLRREGHQVALRRPVTAVTVTVTAQSGATKDYTVNVEHPTVSLPPVVTAPGATVGVDEDAAVGHTVASLSAVDPEGASPLRWAVDDESSRVFEVVATNTGGTTAELRLRAALDFETNSSHRVTIEVSDPGGGTGQGTVTVGVRNVNETGTLILAPSIPALDVEMVGVVSDPDGGVADVAWQWHLGDSATGPWTAIPGAAGAAYTPGDDDLGKYVRLTASYRDALGSGRSVEAVPAEPVARFFEQIGYCYPGGSSCDLTRAGRVKPGGRAYGQIDERYDMDLFRVELEEGRTYRIDALARSSGNGTLHDPWLLGMFAVFDHGGSMDDDGLMDSPYDRMGSVWYDFDDGEHHPGSVYTDDDGGLDYDSRLFVRHFPAGVYYFMVMGVGGSSGTYTVTFNEVEDDQKDLKTPPTITIGPEWYPSGYGSLDFPGDADVFDVALEAGKTYSFVAERTGWWNQDRAGYPYVTQIQEDPDEDPPGAVRILTSDPYRGRPATYTPDTGGTYRITVSRARQYHHLQRGGDYRVKVVNNILAEGRVYFSGGFTAGSTNTALPVMVTDRNGRPDLAFDYQWYRSDRRYYGAPFNPDQVDDGITWTEILGATGPRYTVQTADEGHFLTVRVSFTDNDDNREHIYGTRSRRVESVPGPRAGSGPRQIKPDPDVGKLVRFGRGPGTGPDAAIAAVEADPPDPPSNLAVSSQTHSSVTLVWDDPGDSTIEGYRVLRRSSDGVSHGDGLGSAEFVAVADTGSPATTYTDTTVTPGTRYVYRVRARNSGWLSGESNYANAETPSRAPNRSATGVPVIGGSAVAGPVRVDDTLTVDVSGIDDPNGLDDVSFGYQWLADGADIEGAVDSSYTPGAADTGKAVKVRVSFHDDDGYDETRTSAATSPVQAALPDPPSNLAVSSQTHRSVTLVWDDPGDSTIESYQVLRRSRDGRSYGDGRGAAEFVVVADTGSPAATYTDTTATPRTRYIYRVKARNPAGLSGESRYAHAETPRRPQNFAATGVPVIEGPAQVHETLTADVSGIDDANGLDDVSFGYQWLADGAVIEGAVDSSYTPGRADLAKAVNVRVSFHDDDGYLETRTSAATSPLEAVLPDPPSNLAVSSRTHSSVSLVWDDPGDSTIETYEVLRRSVDADYGDGRGAAEFVVVGETGSPAVTHTDTTVTPGTRYVYRVRARNFVGLSEVSRYARAETPSRPVNRSATGVPVIGGSAVAGSVRVGETLTADVSGIDDANGLDDVSFGYQWLADGAAIEGAADSSYTPGAADLAKAVRVRVSFSDDDGYAETRTSAATPPVQAALPDPPSNLVASRNNNSVTLVWDDPGDSTIEGYQVLRRYRDFSYGDGLGAAEFVVVGETGSPAVTYTDTTARPRTRYAYGVRARSSVGLSEVSGYANVETPSRAPNRSATGMPVVEGSARVDETLTVDVSGIDDPNGLNNATYHYRWLADGAAIEGAVDSSYTPGVADTGKAIKVRVSFHDDDGYWETRTSGATSPTLPRGAALPDPPSRPSSLAVSSRTHSSVSLVWDDPGDSTIETYLVLRRSVDGRTYGDGRGAAQFVVVADTGSPATTYTDTTATPRTRYIYRVKARNPGGLSEESRYAHAETPRRPHNQSATGVPVVEGSARVRHTLTADVSGIDDPNGMDDATFGYRWLADGAAIEGAVDSSYTPGRADLAKAVRVRVSFHDDDGYPETRTSQAVGPVDHAGEQPDNRPATGVPVIEGPARVRDTLTVDVSGIDDPDGMDDVSFGYQWLADGAAIEGAVDSSYTLGAAETGKAVRVRVSFHDDDGYLETRTSAATPPLEAASPDPPSNLAVPSQTHSSVTLVWDDPGDSTIETYEVLRRSVDADYGDGRGAAEFVVVGETGSPAVTHTDTTVTPRTRYVYRVRARNFVGLSEVSRYARAETPSRPVNRSATGVPVVGGSARVDETLTADVSGIDDPNGLDDVSFGYQWLADDAAIEGAVDSSYTPGRADLAKAVKVRVSFHDDDGYPETLTSQAVGPVDHQVSEQRVNRPATGVPVIEGPARVHQTLTVDVSGIADADGLDDVSFGYQWLGDGAAIEGAVDSSYTLDAADTGKAVRVRVSFSDDAGFAETRASAATAAVAPAASVPATVTGVQLTAEFSDVPESHDGSVFTFKLTFTPEPDLSYSTLRDDGFIVVNGSVTKSERVVKNPARDLEWIIHVQPDLDDDENPAGDVSITLPPTMSCSGVAAVCTSDGLPLSNSSEATVPLLTDGPERPGPPQDVTASPGPDIGEITLTWTAAEVGSDADAAVRGYRVRYYCTGETVTTLHGPDTFSVEIGGLDRSQNCRIDVAARNDGGYGQVGWAGSDSTYHQPLNPPEAPASITVTADEDSGGTGVSWTAPASGAAPTSYQIAYWDIDEGRFQYVSHSSTTDLEAVIAVAPADLRTVAVRGHLGDVAYENRGVWGSWAVGWHSSATPSRLDAMTQSSSLSLELTHADDDGTAGRHIDLTGITGAMCPTISGVYVDTANDTAWVADICSRWVHAYDIGADGTLTHNLETSLTMDELYPEGGVGRLDPIYSPTTLWSDGEVLWVAERDIGMLLPYRLSDGALLFDQRFIMAPVEPQFGHSFLAPAAVWSDGETAWVVDDMISGLIFAVALDHEHWLSFSEEVFVSSAFDSCYIPEHPRGSDLMDAATCTDETALRDVIDERYDESVGAYSDGRWLWVAVDYWDSGRAGQLLAFNLLSGERAADRDITLHADITSPAGIWSDGQNLWVTDGRAKRLYTFNIPQGDAHGPAETVTSQNPPSRPSNLVVSSQTHSSVSLVWDDPGDSTIETYQVLRRSRDVSYGDGRGPAQFVVVADTGSSATTYTDTTATPRVRYVYRVKARNSAGLSEVSSYANAETPLRPVDSPATGVPVIEGSAVVDGTLTVDVSGVDDANGLDSVSFGYQWLADDVAIEGAVGSSYTPGAADLAKAIKVRVSFSDDDGYAETLTSAATVAVAPPLLTAGVHDAPDSHDGTTAFTFELRFSEELSLGFSYVTLRDHAFTVTGGTVTGARRLERPENGVDKNIRWEITVKPDTSGEVTVTLPATVSCDDEGAICTQDGRMFSAPLELTVTRSEG